MEQEINVLALVKGEERYVFIYSDEKRSDLMRTLGRYASDATLSFSWYDAAVLSQKIRRERQQQSLETSRKTRYPLSANRAKTEHER